MYAFAAFPHPHESWGRMAVPLMSYNNLSSVRRFFTNALLLALALSVCATTSVAIATDAHACCLRAPVQHAEHSCSGHSHQHDSQTSISAQAPGCHACCLGLRYSSTPRLQPGPVAVTATRDPHPFISEFYPDESSADKLSAVAQRAPPPAPS